ncbi:MAG TPA: hypothetical protein VEN79_02985 [Terriglobia bacterium]|nr:hypothetical protein [Terriglobia bacterium]
MTRTLTRSMIFSIALTLSPMASLYAWPNQEPPTAEASKAKGSRAKLAGTWEGKCQDGRTFVVVVLEVNENKLGGTVSIGNMHGDDVGACMLVTAPPLPEHAQKIGDAVVEHNTVFFHGSQRPDGRFARFELKEMAPDKAELKLLGTPVEEHPWQLVKVQKTE